MGSILQEWVAQSFFIFQKISWLWWCWTADWLRDCVFFFSFSFSLFYFVDSETTTFLPSFFTNWNDHICVYIDLLVNCFSSSTHDSIIYIIFCFFFLCDFHSFDFVKSLFVYECVRFLFHYPKFCICFSNSRCQIPDNDFQFRSSPKILFFLFFVCNFS